MDLKRLKKKLNENIEKVMQSLGVKYEILGDNLYCKCPIHEGSDNPKGLSFSIDKGIWKCWTRDCQFHYRNDIFGLIRGVLSKNEVEEKTFSDALRWSCNLLKVKMSKYEEENEEEILDPFVNTVSILSEKEEEKDHKILDFDFGDNNCPSEYFQSRGFKKSTLEYFGVGDCLTKGVLYERAIIPIHDDFGKNIVGLIGRATKEYKSPKFLFFPKGFDKRYFLYNYHRAIKKTVETNTLFIVEGQGDVWRLYEAGVKNVVSIFGKTITKQQENKINKLPITSLVILTDNDQAGKESKTQIKRQFSRMYKLIFPRINAKDVGDMKLKEVKQMLEELKGKY